MDQHGLINATISRVKVTTHRHATSWSHNSKTCEVCRRDRILQETERKRLERETNSASRQDCHFTDLSKCPIYGERGKISQEGKGQCFYVDNLYNVNFVSVKCNKCHSGFIWQSDLLFCVCCWLRRNLERSVEQEADATLLG